MLEKYTVKQNGIKSIAMLIRKNRCFRYLLRERFLREIQTILKQRELQEIDKQLTNTRMRTQIRTPIFFSLQTTSNTNIHTD